jgi:hypothetical protein
VNDIFDYLDAPMLRVTSEDVPMPYSKNLERSAIPDEAKIIKAVKRVLARYVPEEEQQPELAVGRKQGQNQTEEEIEEEEEARRSSE